jgi:uncharacterized protein with von Willebrand factor type A (vWA) domain
VKVYRYSRWDGSQAEFRMDAEQALDALSELLMEGLDVSEALEWMRQAGFELGGNEMRVMGVDELVRELREEARSLYERYRMDGATDELRRRFEEILDREQRALERAHGHESQRLNQFLERRHHDQAEQAGLADAIERFRDHSFEDSEAEDAYRELLEELERLRALERFQQQQGERFRGSEQADYETAQEIRERIQSLEQMAQDLADGNFSEISPEALQELLDAGAVQSLIFLRDLRSSLENAGYLREGQEELTPKAIRRLGASALAQVYDALRKGRPGTHESRSAGVGLPRPDETRSWQFGDSLDIAVVRTLIESVLRQARENPGSRLTTPLRLAVDDFRVHEMDYTTQTTTVLLLDMSWSMSWAGRFPAAKRVALALDHLIRSRYPRDHFFVVGFYTRAVELSIRELPEASWNMGDPFTNLQEGLMVAERLIAKHPSPSPQILVITDGQPTAYFVDKELRVEWPMGFGGISPRAAEETLKQVRRVTRRGATINTFMLDDAPELVGFVERMTAINKGRAFFTRPGQLGSYLMVDYLSRRRKRWK